MGRPRSLLGLLSLARRPAASADVILHLAPALRAADDAATVRRLVLEAVVPLVPDLHHAAWIDINARGVMYPREIVGPAGPLPRANIGIEAALDRSGSPGPTPRRVTDSGGHPTMVVSVPARIAAPAAFALTSASPIPSELDELLVAVGTAAALALDALAQGDDAHDRSGDARLQQLVRHSADAVLITGRDGRIRYQSPSVVRVLGYLTVDLDGAELSRIVHPTDAPHVAGFIDQLVHSVPESVRSAELQLVRADGSAIFAEVMGSNLLDNPDVRGIVLTIRDVTGRRTLEDQLRHQAFHDPLTGLSNRALFLDRVDHALDRIRSGESPTPAVAFIDLDDFKLVNDTMGHGAGDELLRVVADRLRSCLRSGDTPARLGGDEFAVLLEDAPDIPAVMEVAERILDALNEPATIDGHEVYARASIGVATRRGPTTTPDDLLRNADLAMYTAKAGGKGCVRMFEPTMQSRAVDRLTFQRGLERSIDRGEVDLAFQPIVNLQTREIVSFEAHPRWPHAEHGPLSPSELLRAVDESGAMMPLGRILLDRACRQLEVWRGANPDAEWSMSVNLSSGQILHPELTDAVEGAIADTGIDPSCLVIEMTESVLLTDSERVLRRLHHLKDMGVKIAIDDFGTGYSSLSYLQRVPFDLLKIDQIFVRALRQQPPSATLVRTILELSSALGRVAVAEGVEEQIEIDGLLELGCELGQGPLLGPVGDAGTIAEWAGIHGSAA